MCPFSPFSDAVIARSISCTILCINSIVSFCICGTSLDWSSTQFKREVSLLQSCDADVASDT